MNQKLVWQLAFRYMRGKRGLNAVPILSRISMAAIAVGSAAMIILFSVFNGFEGVVKDLYKAFYPEIKITAARGKFFHLDDAKKRQLETIPGIQYISYVAEDYVFVRNDDEQNIVIMKGIDRSYLNVNDIRQYIIDGNNSVSDADLPTAIVGVHIAQQLGLDIRNVTCRLTVYHLDKKMEGFAQNPESAIRSVQLRPDGLFRIQDEFDSKYVLAPLSTAQELFNEPGNNSSVEIKLNAGVNEENVKHALQKILGSSVTVASRYEQNRTLYLVMRTEKWVVYAILLLVLLIASFNMIGALSLLVLEKQKDMSILKAMGATSGMIQNIFVAEGLLWSLTGGLIGLVTGTIICLVQIIFKPIKLEGAFIIDAYPVVLEPMDFAVIILTIIIVGILAAWYPAIRATRVEAPSLKS